MFPAQQDQPISWAVHASTAIPFFQSGEFMKLCHGLDDQFVIMQEILDPVSGNPTGHFLVQLTYRQGLGRFLSTRAIVWHGPVFYSPTENANFLAALKKLSKVIPWYTLFIQFRNQVSDETLAPIFRLAGYRFSDRLNLIKPVSNLDEAWKTLSESRKRQIRKSLANGLQIERNPDEDDVRAFYQILFVLYKQIKKPLPGVDFFLRFRQLVLSGEIKGFISIARFRGEVVGGLVCPYDDTGRVYEYYICGLDKEMAAYQVYPSVFLTWEGMQRGAGLGCKMFDFMGLGMPDRPYGVRDFKLRFGGELVNPGRWNRIHNRPLYFVAEMLYNFLDYTTHIRQRFKKGMLFKKIRRKSLLRML